jgi:Xaa-Pro dipeptidase
MADPRLAALLDETGADLLVSADPGHVRMLAGHTADLETGPSAFALPPIVVAPGDGEPILVCSADEDPGDGTAETYEGFTVGPVEPTGGAADALRRALARARGTRALVERAVLPLALQPALPDGWIHDDAALARLGAVKTPAEIALVERSIAVCDAGQAAARAASVPGATELDVWAAARRAMEAAAGERCAALADLVAGPRTGEVGGAPSDRPLADGDVVLCDLVPRVDGIWGDSCAAWAVGEPSAAALALHAAADAALDEALARLRPGAIAGDIDAAARAVLRDAGHDYPHHTGHGLGFHWHEEPRIVPDSPQPLCAGMIVALEPGAYQDDIGVRVEVVAEVVDDGHRVLSRHALTIMREGDHTPRGGEDG